IDPRQEHGLRGRCLNQLFDTRGVSEIGENDIEPSGFERSNEFVPSSNAAEAVTRLPHDRLKLREFDLVGTRRVGIDVIQNRRRIIRCIDLKADAAAQYQQLVTTTSSRPG